MLMTDVPFTGFSPTLGTDATTPTQSDSVSFYGLSQNDQAFAQALRRVNSKSLKRLILTLLGDVIGTTAVETRAQVLAVDSTFEIDQYGGLVPITTVNVINRATTDTDVDNINAILRRSRPPVAYYRSYNESNDATVGNRVLEPFDALLGVSFNLGLSHMVRRP